MRDLLPLNMKGVDYLVCGVCQSNFPLSHFGLFIEHKKVDCDLGPKPLLCQSCELQFVSPWKLLQHFQRIHQIQIYQEPQKAKDYSVDCDASWQVNNNETSNCMPQTLEVESNLQLNDSVLNEKVSEVATQKALQPSSMPTIYSNPTSYTLTSNGVMPLTHTMLPVGSQSVPCNKGQSVLKFPAKEESPVYEKKMLDSATQTVECDRAESLEKSLQICCSDDDCGVSKVPVTHEPAQKCCIAVVPKKRKRHMERIHLNNLNDFNGTIQISVGPEEQSGDEEEEQPELENPKVEQNSEENTVIIPPGTTFSIPIVGIPVQTFTSSSLQDGKPIYARNSNISANDNRFIHHPPQEAFSAQEVSRLVVPDSEAGKTNALKSDVNQDSSSLKSLGNIVLDAGTWPGVPFVDCEKGEGENKKRRYPTSRPFKCEQCGQAFNQRIHLRKHKSKHTGVKPFKCDQCDYATVERSHLKVHIRVHTGEKPFKCTFCEYATSQNSTLKIHLKRHHTDTEQLYQLCPAAPALSAASNCEADFEEQSKLISHSIL